MQQETHECAPDLDFEMAVLDMFRNSPKSEVEELLKKLNNENNMGFILTRMPFTVSTVAMMGIYAKLDRAVKIPIDAKRKAINVLEVILKHK